MSRHRTITRLTGAVMAAALLISGLTASGAGASPALDPQAGAPVSQAPSGIVRRVEAPMPQTAAPAPSGIVRRVEAPMPQTPAPTVTQTIDHGFDWASAAIGAAGAGLVLLLVAAGASVASRRHRAPRLAG